MAGKGFRGAKWRLLIGRRLLVYRRDAIPGLPWADRWDLPGGGAERGEPPLRTALRELHEEFGLRLRAGDVAGRRGYRLGRRGGVAWLFRAHLPTVAAARIRFGDEGQYWRLMPLGDFARDPRGIPHLQRLAAGTATIPTNRRKFVRCKNSWRFGNKAICGIYSQCHAGRVRIIRRRRSNRAPIISQAPGPVPASTLRRVVARRDPPKEQAKARAVRAR